jgi:hypothetical protein
LSAAKENVNSTTPCSVRVNKSKTILSTSLDKSDVSDALFRMNEEEDAQIRELTDVSEAENEHPKPVNGIGNVTEHDGLLKGKECMPVSRKRKRLSTEENMSVANKKVAKEKTLCKTDTSENRIKVEETDNEKISEEKEEDHAVQRNENEKCCREKVDSIVKEKLVELEAVEEVQMDIDKVDDTEEVEYDSSRIKAKENKNEIVDTDEMEIKEDGQEGIMIKKENHTEESSVEVVCGEKKDVIGGKIISDGNRDERGIEGSGEKENKELSNDSEKNVIAQKGNRDISKRKDEQGREESDRAGSKNGMKGTFVSEEKDRYKRATRSMGKRREREDDKGNRTDMKEVKTETKVSSEEKDKDEMKDRSIPKKKDKEEKGKDDAAEEKTAADSAAEFRCKDCKEGRNPPCFACGRIQEEKTGREYRQRCAVGKRLKCSNCS